MRRRCFCQTHSWGNNQKVDKVDDCDNGDCDEYGNHGDYNYSDLEHVVVVVEEKEVGKQVELELMSILVMLVIMMKKKRIMMVFTKLMVLEKNVFPGTSCTSDMGRTPPLLTLITIMMLRRRGRKGSN